MAPSVGRIVHYYSTSGSPQAAMITAVNDAEKGLVSLTVFPAGSPPETGHVKVAPRLTIGEDGVARQTETGWEWPPRVDESAAPLSPEPTE